jgi:hypothetical protein
MIEDPMQRIGRPRQLYTGASERSYVSIEACLFPFSFSASLVATSSEHAALIAERDLVHAEKLLHADDVIPSLTVRTCVGF